MMEGSKLPWCVGLMGDALIDSPVLRYVIERGGHLRVGIEDAASRSTASNREMVATAVELARQVGRPVVQRGCRMGCAGSECGNCSSRISINKHNILNHLEER